MVLMQTVTHSTNLIFPELIVLYQIRVIIFNHFVCGLHIF